MKHFDELARQGSGLVVCTPDFAGRLVGKRRDLAEWPDLASRGMAMPSFHLVTNVENRPLPDMAVGGSINGFANGLLLPDTQAAFLSPLLPGTVHVLADPVGSRGERIPEAPREILRAQIARLSALGVEARFASELEFYAFSQSFSEAHLAGPSGLEPIYHRHGDNDVLVYSLVEPFCAGLETALAQCGIVVEQAQTEGGAGQIEVNVRPTHPLASADDHVVFKHVVKALAHQQGRSVTFLAKPFENDAGSGGHIHASFFDSDGKNLMGDTEGNLTAFGSAFVAGLATFTPELTLMHAPYANSYRRLVPMAYTPLTASWGWDNRTAMARLLVSSSGVRVELRLPGADINPYLAYAGLLAAGLAGVERQLPLPTPKVGPAKSGAAGLIPGDLTEALAMFERSQLAESAFGKAVHNHISSHARHELLATRQAVGPWEIRRGFENA